MSIHITTLVENSKGENLSLQNQHGISFYIQSGKYNILFDTGQDNMFIQNANKLNVDLSKTTHVVLSHAHYDHTGGLKDFINEFGTSFELIVNEDFFYKKFAQKDGALQFIGNDFDEEYLHQRGVSIHCTNKDIFYITPEIFIAGNFERISEFERINPRFFIDAGGKYVSDHFNDEIIIGIHTEKGIVVLVGCAHPGIVNILSTIKKRVGKPIYGILGGTHLIEADDKQLTSTLAYFNEIDIKLLGISHCTGDKAVEQLKQQRNKFFYNCTGTSIVLE
ncbi:MBL fold metallo-hydrolase [Petroclostridium sp. X23]|uniref:MBL fold metallo-hydrolase n=1 Tax=Petroclostridium sp. X23 TaxID=3045146 RepID=UPI0024AE33D2|nr:MBL fold metallo-hydrolase [Petroclostridium sp. X23]WHH58058.1 MBL fold metallo-hydrolase [Petroclostridium sp. X23]